MKTERVTAQQHWIAQQTQAAIEQISKNGEAPVIPPQTEIDETKYSGTHLLEQPHYEPPHPELVTAYFKHFQAHFLAYNTDAKLASLLGESSNRRIRGFKKGDIKVPFQVWRRFLIMTGRVPQNIISVLAYMG
ncbi:hypothetical protein [Photobacterium sp. R1]